MATTPLKDEKPTLRAKVGLAASNARIAALGAVLGALVTFSPQPAAAIGAALVVILALELGKKR